MKHTKVIWLKSEVPFFLFYFFFKKGTLELIVTLPVLACFFADPLLTCHFVSLVSFFLIIFVLVFVSTCGMKMYVNKMLDRFTCSFYY